MIRNYLKIAYRNLMKYRFISFINLFGLTVGLSCCLLIMIYILNEVSYDRFQPHSDRVYRVTRRFNNPETGVVSLHLGTVAPPFGPRLQNDFKEIESMTRILKNGTVGIRYEDKMFNEENVYFADEQFHEFFKVETTEGNPKTALTNPYCVIITEDLAHKYFGNEEPMNKVLRLNFGDHYDFKVTGVFKSFPANSHFHPDILLSFNTLEDSLIYGTNNLATNWGNNSFFTFLRLPKNYDPSKLKAQFPAFLDRNMAGQYRVYKPSKATSLDLQRITDIHLYSHTDYEAEENGDIKRIWVFSAIALFILLIACINYMNLSTARSTLRAVEIGIRKVVGAHRKEIINQFLTESVMISAMAMILALGVTLLALPMLNSLTDQQLSMGALLHREILLPVLFVPIIVGLLSGIYPALFMSSFQPVKVLKGFLKVGGGNISFRQVLVTVQFAVSIILIICTAIVFNQMKYMQSKSLGFDKDHILTFPYISGLSANYDAFRTELLSNRDLKNVGRSSRIPTGRLLDAMGARMPSGDTLAFVMADVKYVMADHDFISTYGVKVLAGRGFSREFGLDTSSFMINESAAKVLGFKNLEQAVGKPFGYGNLSGKLIGVINDFHFESLHEKIVPLVLFVSQNPNDYGRISIKMSGNNLPETLTFIESTWKKFLPDTPFQYTFMDENFAKLYKAEERQRTLLAVFASLAIFIACLGLFGLSAFAIAQRVKEIGIRKVLGASMGSLVQLVSRDFLKLVGFAALIAFPVAWFAMDGWLSDFAYRISISWEVFVAAGVAAFLIALITISFQAIKAAVANPVKSLRTE